MAHFIASASFDFGILTTILLQEEVMAHLRSLSPPEEPFILKNKEAIDEVEKEYKEKISRL